MRRISPNHLAITATLKEIDGAGGPNRYTIIGFAGPTRIWDSCPTVSYLGEMAFGVFHIDDMQANGDIEGLILLEVGHVIGKKTKGYASGGSSVGTFLDKLVASS